LGRNKVLVIEADPVTRSGICNFLIARGHTILEAASTHDAQCQFDKSRPDAAILDFSFPNGDALALLQRITSGQIYVPVIALIGQGAFDVATRAMQDGAEQFLIKPLELPLLHAVLLRVLSKPHHGQPPACKTKADFLDPFGGTSAAIHRLQEIARRVVDSESPILLQGETGSGKGVLANWIHRNGPRADAPFMDLNCAGLSRELLESELFGHEKGAFTSAVSAKPGLLEVADGGTVFLDEVGDIDLQVQPKLLKVLENRVFRRLGDVRDRTVNVRLLSATHRDLLDLVRQQRFRSDLYFRVNIVPLRVPPLRERAEDIPVLVRHFLTGLSQASAREEIIVEASAMDALQQYSWPGNIRELRNVLERAALMADQNRLTLRHLQFQTSTPSFQPQLHTITGTLEQVERAYINLALQEEGGCVDRAAARLGIPRSSLYNKMKRFEIPTKNGRPQN
jgi:DNA-binding NtrC family response regulator